jgi:hypothetical protein
MSDRLCACSSRACNGIRDSIGDGILGFFIVFGR